ncbi:uncharacterized protein TNCT_482631 [Trichonephila clavata]|uniref:Uncharacterized protein n=1 Tax=Trichonephila clavata TaxID=2740835 RepID=A0A8X6LW26_TRICU|nr:uncharacterized protein TNCT_482631 [Trichonephila clavata]
MGSRLRRLSTEIRDAEIQGIFPPETELSEPDDADWLSYGHISSRLRKLVPDKVPYPLLIGLADVMIVSALIALAAVSLWRTSTGYITYIEVRLPLEVKSFFLHMLCISI